MRVGSVQGKWLVENEQEGKIGKILLCTETSVKLQWICQ